MLELTLRLIFSLAVVVGLLLLLAKLGAKRFKGGPDALIQVVQRQPLSRTSAISVVTVGHRVLVLGTTEQQVSVLAELDPDELELQLEETAATDDDEAADATASPAYDEVARSATAGTVHPLRSDSPTVQLTSTALRTPTPGTVVRGPLAGSVLSPDTWRRALATVGVGAGAHRADRNA